jgi:hypothetical protein
VIAPAESVHPDDVARVEAYMREMRTRGGSGGGECAPIRFRRKRADGSYIDVESTGSCDVRCARALRRQPRSCKATTLMAAHHLSRDAQGTYIYFILRDVSEEHVAQAALRNLLLSSSFDLRVSAHNVGAAAALLREHDAVHCDAEAVFLAGAIQSSCNLLLGASRVCCAAAGDMCVGSARIAMHMM